ncbi:CYFA0S09e02806g1_1 [Cyberlindnera fabianii]|uniref:Altered inheritance of mitochondria protein 32 n=1 Tax=Cyberlindnera fabianii TaxID=36022 RepID=A0A061AYU6_CYBFA|nr:Altered inheritance of mitochondria protein 32 [Cyberlindnera fabianii]CDR42402.1 CYFA0S09e02806g1_1 [Cyberlindnera fabianii]
MRPTLRRLVALSERYKLIDTPCPAPLITTPKTHCECQFPADSPINHDKPLYGTKAAMWKHAFVHSTVSAPHWKSKVEMMPTELISSLSGFKRSDTDPSYPVGLSNIQLDRPEGVSEKYNVVVFPENKYYAVTEETSQKFMREVLNPNGPPVSLPSVPNTSRVILICGHVQRDIRCGLIAPMLREEFEFNLAKRGLLYSKDNTEGVRVGIVSHIGGHAYAGNVLYYDEEGLTVWYGRCENRHVDGIVEQTIVKKNIIKELFRGQYN